MEFCSSDFAGIYIQFPIQTIDQTIDQMVEILIKPPTKRTIQVDTKKYFLNFPHMLFIKLKSKFYVLGIDKSKNLFFRIPLPNGYPNGEFCLGLNSGETIEEYIDIFYSTLFITGCTSSDSLWYEQLLDGGWLLKGEIKVDKYFDHWVRSKLKEKDLCL